MSANVPPARHPSGARLVRPLGRDARGTSVVEFGLLLPIIFVMLVGTIDMARAFASRLALEQAVHRTIEMAAVGVVGSDYEFLRAEAAQAADVPEAQVRLRQWTRCGTETAERAFEHDCGAAEGARYIAIEVWKSHMPSFSFGYLSKLFKGAQPDGSIRFTAVSSLRVQ
ncbi:MAG: TadE/TadG family type IV pilus assembly protein [Allosphingosinicella sp.]|uniref:TadE/TadG family type IV pilus assembly protein n=1 Tax=Allosphingosinicella sp. TaxID=2823234 RepID=UPI00395A77C6